MRRKKKVPRPTATGSEPCVVCGAQHSLHMGTWIMANDQLLCANDSCWREAVRREIEGEKPSVALPECSD